MLEFRDWLNRTPVKKKPRRPLPRVTKKRAKQLREYSKEIEVFLFLNPICGVWLKENGWAKGAAPREYKREHSLFPRTKAVPELSHWNWSSATADALLYVGALPSEEVHHIAKRRGAMLNEQKYWLAVSKKNHERIEQNKSWARANGFLLNF